MYFAPPDFDIYELLRCFAAPAIPGHSESGDLLRKSLLPHVLQALSSKALSCKYEQLFDLLTLISQNITTLEELSCLN